MTIHREFPIYIQDFTEKAQKRIAEFYGVENVSDLNYDVIPIVTLDFEEELGEFIYRVSKAKEDNNYKVLNG